VAPQSKPQRLIRLFDSLAAKQEAVCVVAVEEEVEREMTRGNRRGAGAFRRTRYPLDQRQTTANQRNVCYNMAHADWLSARRREKKKNAPSLQFRPRKSFDDSRYTSARQTKEKVSVRPLPPFGIGWREDKTWHFNIFPTVPSARDFHFLRPDGEDIFFFFSFQISKLTAAPISGVPPVK
jgi:hypothetical protein